MFITFEGPEGSGKSTQLKMLAEHLRTDYGPVHVTREPGGTPIGEQIRDVLHRLSNTELTPRTEILLFSASRAQHCDELIRPALERGELVLSDRFYDSTFAYQGYGHGLDLTVLRQITAFATGGLTPDLTLYIDIDPEVGLQRKQSDTDLEWNRLDAYALEFHQRVAQGYAQLIKEDPDRWVVIDGDRAVNRVFEDVRDVVAERLHFFKSS